jgi:hypothetical protein
VILIYIKKITKADVVFNFSTKRFHVSASYKTLWEFKTCDGETPLTLAVKAGLVENVKTLLDKGVWPNTKNDKGETPLLIGK